MGRLSAGLERRCARSGRSSERGFPEKIVTPILIVAAGADRVVGTPAERDYVKRLTKANYVEIEGAEHEILM